MIRGVNFITIENLYCVKVSDLSHKLSSTAVETCHSSIYTKKIYIIIVLLVETHIIMHNVNVRLKSTEFIFLMSYFFIYLPIRVIKRCC